MLLLLKPVYVIKEEKFKKFQNLVNESGFNMTNRYSSIIIYFFLNNTNTHETKQKSLYEVEMMYDTHFRVVSDSINPLINQKTFQNKVIHFNYSTSITWGWVFILCICTKLIPSFFIYFDRRVF